VNAFLEAIKKSIITEKIFNRDQIHVLLQMKRDANFFRKFNVFIAKIGADEA
jgi:hypothetical protein